MKNATQTLIAGTMINLTIGVIYAWSVIKRALVSEWGWTNSQANAPYTIGIVVWALSLLAAGMLQDKFGPKRVIQIGVALVGLGLIASSQVSTPEVMIFTFGVVVATGIGFAYACITPCCMKWFHPSKKGMVSGITVGGFGLAAVYLAPLASRLIDSFGVSEALLILGVGVLIVAPPLTLLIDNPPESYTHAIPPMNSNSGTKRSQPTHDYSWRQMVKTKQFYYLWIMFALSSSAGVMMIGHLASIASLQAGVVNVAFIVSLLAVSNAAGRVGGGWLSDKIGRKNTMLLVFTTQLINMIGFINYNNMGLISMGTIVAGLSYGSLMSVFPSTIADNWGMKNYGTNYGLLYLAWGASGIAGPLIAAWVVDTTGSYEMAYTISAVLLAIAIVLGAVSRPLTSPPVRSMTV
jgi:MFS family permease